MKVLVIGAGNMGLTYSEGMAKSPLLNRKNLMIHDVSEDLLKKLSEVSYYDTFDNLQDCVPNADVVFLAVKPYHSEELFERMKPMLDEQQIIVSLMAGVTIENIQNGLNVKKVVRTMPNLPAKVGKGVTSYTESKEVSRVELLMIRNLLDTTGQSIRVKNEDFINKSTGISGSGPAYIFYFMASMLDAAKKMGFSDHDSKILVSNTFEGAVHLFNESDLSPEKWMDRVASKGGTTRAALDSMDDNNVKQLIQDAAYAAFNRAVELGDE
ncbi:pyrroline-5-carboxylate reductase ProC [Psychroflexus torquis ATCC 700755]|uniref:Pyrroline-5-carboxylate reductase n=1 Tax=Psychroflexus torquis (strain ATCC 700755 / CIP 106069 / ACAM 623) TaxID=313595 RepID=K4INS7_PSYTT|nr:MULTISPECIES: pyrroline-5-carboxylate reductase [Psychroflexus]AFU67200.1 pyrroline-5-carboxylate reductase ProC [Psychroflexus torquis ATCC 700755]PKG43051.1 pyrroline-5-carboxylate reductase [Psychroflexus sp. MES1-P1E]